MTSSPPACSMEPTPFRNRTPISPSLMSGWRWARPRAGARPAWMWSRPRSTPWRGRSSCWVSVSAGRAPLRRRPRLRGAERLPRGQRQAGDAADVAALPARRRGERGDV